MYLGHCCAECRKRETGLGVVGWDDAAVFVISEIVGGALQRAAHARAKKKAWEAALQRIPEDDFVDYADYVRSQPDLYNAWEKGLWLTGRGATLPEFGLIHIREFGPREGVKIKALKPGPRPNEGPSNGFAMGWPVQVLRKLKPLANPVPAIVGVNAMDAAPPATMTPERLALIESRNPARAARIRAMYPQLATPGLNVFGVKISPLILVTFAVGAYFIIRKRRT